MEAAVQRASFLDTVKTVLCAAVGIRRRADHERAEIRPAHVAVVAVVLLVLFVLTLRFVVSLVVR